MKKSELLKLIKEEVKSINESKVIDVAPAYKDLKKSYKDFQKSMKVYVVSIKQNGFITEGNIIWNAYKSAVVDLMKLISHDYIKKD